MTMTPDLMSDTDLLLAREVAQLFGVKRQVVNAWARRGWLPSITTPGGGLRLYPRADVERLLAEHTEPRVAKVVP